MAVVRAYLTPGHFRAQSTSIAKALIPILQKTQCNKTNVQLQYCDRQTPFHMGVPLNNAHNLLHSGCHCDTVGTITHQAAGWS